MLLCDGCDSGFHMHCLDPPLTTIPQASGTVVFVWLDLKLLHHFLRLPLLSSLVASFSFHGNHLTHLLRCLLSLLSPLRLPLQHQFCQVRTATSGLTQPPCNTCALPHLGLCHPTRSAESWPVLRASLGARASSTCRRQQAAKCAGSQNPRSGSTW